MRVGHGAYLQDIASFNKYAYECNPVPKKLCVKLGKIDVVSEIEKVDVST